jgi:hypothetical protein
MTRRSLTLITLLILIAVSLMPVGAQNEGSLRSFFEGKPVLLLKDLPGTNEGVSVPIGRSTDFKEYGERLKRYGVALHAGDRTVVTFVKVKKDLIEFQLAGGGYGTFGDDTSTSVNIPFAEKGQLETELETELKDEKDPARRKWIERDLDEMRRYRERENRRITAEREMISDYKQRLVALKRQQGGSRFNLRFEKSVPAGFTPNDVMAALNDFVDFSNMNMPISADRPRDQVVDTRPRRGMLRDDAERVFGPPVEATRRSEGSLTVATVTFIHGSERITADFVEDVMIRFVIERAQ